MIVLILDDVPSYNTMWNFSNVLHQAIGQYYERNIPHAPLAYEIPI